MKIRNGFVSNSSSSSFCILGILIETGDNSYFKSFDSKLLVEEYGIETYCESSFLGAYPEQMKDDETLAQFKERIIADINVNFPDASVSAKDLEWYTDGGYDG